MNKNTKDLPALAICYQTHPKNANYPVLYVSQTPGEGGPGWGYTKKPEGTELYDYELGERRAFDAAKPLSPYWQRRFRRDCERVGMNFHSIPYEKA